tara:strand:- start:3210 stop:3611 length:402 start_codon:yes stop_codon:yes gene_type:complete
MSVVGLGDRAVVGELIASRVQSDGIVVSTQLDNTDTTAPTTGFHKISSSAGAVGLSLPDGKDGDVVEFVHVAGGNTIAITPVNFRGPAVKIDFTTVAGGYVKLVFISTTWYLLIRNSDAVAGAAAVANLPAIA